MVFNPGIDVANQPLRDAWWTSGWTAQNQSYLPVPANQFAEPGFPTGLSYVNVSGNYFDGDGNPVSGYLTFFPSSSLTFTSAGVTTFLPQRYVGLNQNTLGFNQFGNGKVYLWNGQFSVSLLATDNASANMIPVNFSYHVVEHWNQGREYDIYVPSNSTNPVDINSLIIPGTPGGELPPEVLTISVASTEFVPINITAIAGGFYFNPTTDEVDYAFINGPQAPQNSDWHTGQWAAGGPPYIAQILVGPANGGLVLAKGSYIIWNRVIASPQVPAFTSGTLVIY